MARTMHSITMQEGTAEQDEKSPRGYPMLGVCDGCDEVQDTTEATIMLHESGRMVVGRWCAQCREIVASPEKPSHIVKAWRVGMDDGEAVLVRFA